MSIYTATVDQPYFDFLIGRENPNYKVETRKIYEGRVKSPAKWAKVKPGDYLYLSEKAWNETRKFLVEEIVEARDFYELYEKLGQELLPELPTMKELGVMSCKGTACDPWTNCYVRYFDEKDVDECEVVGLKVKEIV